MLFVPTPEYLALPRAPEAWIIQDLLPVGGFLNIYGKPKAGKTLLALQLAVDISSGSSKALNWPIRTNGPVCYLQVDTPRGLFSSNYLEKAIKVGFDVSNVFIADQDIVPYPFSILGDGRRWLEEALSSLPIPPVALIVDTVREIHSGDENDSSVMRNVFVSLVAATHSVTPHPALIVLSHSRKGTFNVAESEEDIMEGNRGSSYVAGRVDGILKVGNCKKGITTCYYQSRTIEETHAHFGRTLEGFFILPLDSEIDFLRELIIANPKASNNAIAKLATEKFTKVVSPSTWLRKLPFARQQLQTLSQSPPPPEEEDPPIPES